MKTFLMTLAVVFATTTTFAERITWEGADSGGTLLMANWRPESGGTLRAPRAGDRLVIPAGKSVITWPDQGAGTAGRTNQRNEYAMLVKLDGIDLGGSFTLQNPEVNLSLPETFTLSGSGTFKMANGVGKRLDFNADSSGFSGEFTAANTLVHLNNPNALGTASITVSRGAYATYPFFFISVPGEYRNPIKIDVGTTWYGMELEGGAAEAGSVTTLSGLVQYSAGSVAHCARFDSKKGKLILSGGMSCYGNGDVDFNGDVTLSGEGSYGAKNNIFCDSGTLCIAAQIDGSTKKVLSKTTIEFGAEEVLNGVPLDVQGNGIFDFKGFSQNTASVSNSGATQKLTSDGEATLTITGESASIGAAIGGNLSIAYANADGTLTLTSAASTTDGELVAESGTVVLDSAARLQSVSAIRAKTSGVISIGNVLNFSKNVEFHLEGGTIVLPEGVVAVSALYDQSGEKLPMGSYAKDSGGGATAVDGLAGNGVVQVIPMPEEESGPWVWTGLGGDNRISSPGNWKDNKPPTDFMSTGNIFQFPANATVEVDRAVTVKKFLFDGDESGSIKFTMSGDNGGITVYNGVVDFIGGGSKSVLFDVPIQYYLDFNLSVPPGNRVDFTGILRTIDTARMVKKGRGTFGIFSDGNVINGDVVNSNGWMYVGGSAPLAGTGGLLNYQYTPTSGQSLEDMIFLTNAVVARSVYGYAQGNVNVLTPFIKSVANTENVIQGKVVQTAVAHLALMAEDNSQLTVGGVEPYYYFVPVLASTALIRIDSIPVTKGNQYYNDANNLGVVALAVAGNKFGGNENATMRVGSTLRTEVDGAIDQSRSVQISDDYGTFDLWGTTQRVTDVFRVVRTTSGNTVTKLSGETSVSLRGGNVIGAPGSYLACVGNATGSIAPILGGAVSFERAGTGWTVFRMPNVSTGDLIVSGGRVEFAAPGAKWLYNDVEQDYGTVGGSWAGDKIMVTGGTLVVDHRAALSRTAEIYVDGGKISIADGVRLRVSNLYVKESGAWRKLTGVYGSSSSPAPEKRDDIFDVGSSGCLICGRIGLMLVVQ